MNGAAVEERCLDCNESSGQHVLGCPTRTAESVRREPTGAGSPETVECPACGTRVAHLYVGDIGQVGLHPDPATGSACGASFGETVMRGHLDLVALRAEALA